MCTPRWVVYCHLTSIWNWIELSLDSTDLSLLPLGMSTASLFPGARLVAVQQTPCFAHHLRPKRLNLRHETCQNTRLTSQSHVSRWFQIFLNLVSLMEISISTNLHPSSPSSAQGLASAPTLWTNLVCPALKVLKTGGICRKYHREVVWNCMTCTMLRWYFRSSNLSTG